MSDRNVQEALAQQRVLLQRRQSLFDTLYQSSLEESLRHPDASYFYRERHHLPPPPFYTTADEQMAVIAIPVSTLLLAEVVGQCRVYLAQPPGQVAGQVLAQRNMLKELLLQTRLRGALYGIVGAASLYTAGLRAGQERNYSVWGIAGGTVGILHGVMQRSTGTAVVGAVFGSLTAVMQSYLLHEKQMRPFYKRVAEYEQQVE